MSISKRRVRRFIGAPKSLGGEVAEKYTKRKLQDVHA